MSRLFDRQLTIPDYEFFYSTIGYGTALSSFYVILTFYVQNPLLRSNTEIEQVRRAMRVLRVSTILSILLTLPLFYLNSVVEPPTASPMTSFVKEEDDEAKGGSFGGLGNSNAAGNGRMSWNFSVCRPIFAVLCFTASLVADNHRFFRVVAVLMLFSQICCDTIAAFDIAKASRLLDTKCDNSFDPETWDDSDLTECLASRDNQWWGVSQLAWMLRRDMVCASLETLSLFLVCFVGVALGFRKNRYSYHDIHPRFNNSQKLWNELNKRNITTKNFKEKVKANERPGEGEEKQRLKLK